MDPFLPVQITGIVAITVSFLASLRAVMRWYELRRTAPPADVVHLLRDVQARLDLIEQTVDTTAIEMERVAEANRFVAKVLAERSSAATPLPRAVSPERVITPH